MQKYLGILIMTNTKAEHYCYTNILDSMEEIASWMNKKETEFKENEIYLEMQVDELNIDLKIS